jgi:transketolase
MNSGDHFLDETGISLRLSILEALREGGRGHLGPAFSILDILRVLYGRVLVHDPKEPSLSNRDRFILSKGHGCLALYGVLAHHGYFPKEDLSTFCKFDSPLGGHPESATTLGVEFSTGSLGHGLSVGVGVALAARIRNETWRTYVLLGDGEVNEGSVWEAALHASKHNLSTLCVIIDFNKMQASGNSQEVLDMSPMVEKWKAFGFEVHEIDGHSLDQIEEALSVNKMIGAPRLIVAHTTKGKGIPSIENSSEWHHKAKIKSAEVDLLVSELISQ